MNRERLVVGNWKMHTNLADAVVLTSRIRDSMDRVSNDVTVVLCPPTIWLYPVAEILERSADHLQLAAQNVWPGKDGRYTGETSAWMLAQMCQFVLIGHSERRVHQSEDHRLINQKLKATLAAGLRPILCIGEFRRLVEDRSGQLKARRGDTANDLFGQLRDAVAGIAPDDLGRLVVAYEPVWAISGVSGGQTADLAHSERVIRQLRSALDDYAGASVSRSVPMLYGGSVTAATAERFAHSAEIDGVLVGAASLKAKEFLEIASSFHHRTKKD